jgi:acyl carrier protein
MERAEFFSDLTGYLRTRATGARGPELTPQTNLFDAGYLESLELPGLLSYLEQKLGVELDLTGLTAESFFTMESIFASLVGPARNSDVGLATSSISAEVRSTWAKALGRPLADIHEHSTFGALGASSDLIDEISRRLGGQFGLAIPPGTFSELDTVGDLSALVSTIAAEDARRIAADVVLLSDVPVGQKIPRLFLFHPVGGTVLAYQQLARALRGTARVYGVQSPHLRAGATVPTSLEGTATDLAAQIRAIQPDGPYWLGGWSFGAALAAVVGRQLSTSGEVGPVFMLDPWVAGPGAAAPARDALEAYFRAHGARRSTLGDDPANQALFNALRVNSAALTAYRPVGPHGRAIIFEAARPDQREVAGLARLHADPDWTAALVVDAVHAVDGGHDAVVKGAAVPGIGEKIAATIGAGVAGPTAAPNPAVVPIPAGLTAA